MRRSSRNNGDRGHTKGLNTQIPSFIPIHKKLSTRVMQLICALFDVVRKGEEEGRMGERNEEC